MKSIYHDIIFYMQSILIFQQDSVRDKEGSSLAISDSSYRNLIFFTSKIILEEQKEVHALPNLDLKYNKKYLHIKLKHKRVCGFRLPNEALHPILTAK